MSLPIPATLLELPAEQIHRVCQWLLPIDVFRLSRTCRLLSTQITPKDVAQAYVKFHGPANAINQAYLTGMYDIRVFDVLVHTITPGEKDWHILAQVAGQHAAKKRLSLWLKLHKRKVFHPRYFVGLAQSGRGDLYRKYHEKVAIGKKWNAISIIAAAGAGQTEFLKRRAEIMPDYEVGNGTFSRAIEVAAKYYHFDAALELVHQLSLEVDDMEMLSLFGRTTLGIPRAYVKVTKHCLKQNAYDVATAAVEAGNAEVLEKMLSKYGRSRQVIEELRELAEDIGRLEKVGPTLDAIAATLMQDMENEDSDVLNSDVEGSDFDDDVCMGGIYGNSRWSLGGCAFDNDGDDC